MDQVVLPDTPAGHIVFLSPSGSLEGISAKDVTRVEASQVHDIFAKLAPLTCPEASLREATYYAAGQLADLLSHENIRYTTKCRMLKRGGSCIELFAEKLEASETSTKIDSVLSLVTHENKFFVTQLGEPDVDLGDYAGPHQEALIKTSKAIDWGLHSISVNTIRLALAATLTRLGAVKLMQRGHVYFLPTNIEQFVALRDELFPLTGESAACVQAGSSDEVAKAVLWGLQEEVSDFIKAAEESLQMHASASPESVTRKFGKKVKTKAAQGEELEKRVLFFESLLGEHAKLLAAQMGDVRSSLTIAALSGE